MTLQAALKEIAENIEADGYSDEARDLVCEEYSINPVLLARKFEEQHGCTMQQFEAKAFARAANKEIFRAADKAAAEKAKERAEAERAAIIEFYRNRAAFDEARAKAAGYKSYSDMMWSLIGALGQSLRA